MKKLLVTFALGFAGCAALFAGLSYHFILTGGDPALVVEKKGELGFTDTFVDTRAWGLGDWLKHPRIGALVAKHGLKSALGTDSSQGAVERGKKAVDEGLEKLQETLRK